MEGRKNYVHLQEGIHTNELHLAETKKGKGETLLCI